MAKQTKDDDLFSGSTMTFGEHLEELRGSLFRSLVGLIAGFIIGLFIAKYMVALVKSPLASALEEYYLASAMDKLDEDFKKDPPPEQISIIKEKGLIPEPIYVEPTALLEQLKAEFPDQLRGVSLSEYVFSTSDVALPNVPQLCSELIEYKVNPSGKQQTLHALLSEQDQQFLKAVAKKSETDAKDHARLIVVLNRLIDVPAVHEGDSFNSLLVRVEDPRLQASIQSMHARLQEQPDTIQSRRLNRLLISGGLSDYSRAGAEQDHGTDDVEAGERKNPNARRSGGIHDIDQGGLDLRLYLRQPVGVLPNLGIRCDRPVPAGKAFRVHISAI